MSTLITCTSSTRPATPSAGDTLFETDSNKIIVYEGSAWKEYQDNGQLYSDSTITSLSPQLWLDGSNGDFYTDASKATSVSADGRLVGCWADRSGNSFDFSHTVNGQKPNIIQNLGTTNSTGLAMTSDTLTFTGSASSELTSSCTVFFAHKFALHGQWLMVTTDNSTRMRAIPSSDYSSAYFQCLPFAGSPSFQTANTEAVADTLIEGVCLLGIRKDVSGNTTELYLNGGSSAASTTAGSSAYLKDGVTYKLTDPAAGEGPNISFEHMAFGSALSNTEMDSVFNYLSKKYGTTVTAVS